MVDVITYPTPPIPETPEAKLEKLRAHLREQSKLFAEFAESPTLTAETSILFGYEDAPHCPLGFNVTPDGERVAVLSGDGLGVSFRFQDVATLLNELTRCAMDAAGRKGTTNLIRGIQGAFGKGEAEDIIVEASNFLQGQRDAQDAAKKAAMEEMGATAAKIQDMVTEVEKIAGIAADAVKAAVSDDQPETSAEGDAMDEHELKQP